MATTNLLTSPIPLPPWLMGLVEETDPHLLQPGSIADGENFVPQRSPRMAARGGSRVMLTLNDDAGTPAELSHVLGLSPKAATGAIVVGWSSGTTKHYAYAVTSDMAFAGASEALSRTAFPTTWNRATPARPIIASLFEKLYVCDATQGFSARNTLVVIDAAVAPVITEPVFEFVAGGAAAAALRPYCLEEYNNVLFIAGYGDEETGASDDVALVRHSFLAKAPDLAGGFDKDAYNTIGARGDRVTAMRKGRGLLLIAKANELHRLSGFGRAYPGWQYQVEGVDNTLGMGVENPLALEHAQGYWYGLGKQGPFRTDGFTVDSLTGPRQRTWRGIDQYGAAWVRYHPERRVVLFGVHVVAGAPDVTHPWVLMVWDTERNVWQPNWTFGGSPRLFVAQAIATTTAQGPGAPPSAPNTTNLTTTAWRANWTNGDATAETEYWEQNVTAAGAYQLVAVIAPGTTLFDQTARTNHNEYKWRVRHRKNGVYSAYTADLTVKTLIAAPGLSSHCVQVGGGGGGTLRPVIDVTQNAGGTTLVLESSPTGTETWTVFQTWVNQPTGTVSTGVVTNGKDWRAKSTDSAWTPTESAYTQINNVNC